MSVSQAHKDIFRRLYQEVWNDRKFELIEQVIAKSHALGDPTLTGSAVGPEAYRRQVERFVAGFPDLHFAVDDTVSEKDKMVVSWTVTGTHKGEFLGIAPTNKKVSVSGITINEISNGKILESVVIWDALGLFQQLGLNLTAKSEKRAASSR
jgi:steroid delta-isomerase-like uncharacterized protein